MTQMQQLYAAAAALVWLAACGPRGNANRAGRETGMAGDTASVTRAPAVGGDTGVSAGRPGAAGVRTDSMDAAGILTMLSTANLQEIHEAQYVQKNTKNAAVKALARKLEADHSANLQKARKLANQLGVSQRLPSDSAQANAAPAQLQGMTGAALDSAFVAQQAEAHQTNIDRIRSQMIPAAQNAQLKQYLQQTLAAMQGHLRQVQQVQRQLGHD
jgi:putative membrane protein